MMNALIVVAIVLAVYLLARFWIFRNWFAKRKTETEYEKRLSEIRATEEGRRVADEIRLTELDLERTKKQTLTEQEKINLIQLRKTHLELKRSLLKSLKDEEPTAGATDSGVEDSQNKRSRRGKKGWSVMISLVSLAAIVIWAGMSFLNHWEWPATYLPIIGMIAAAVLIIRRLNSNKKNKVNQTGNKTGRKSKPGKKKSKEITQLFYPHWLWISFLAMISLIPITVLILNLSWQYSQKHPAIFYLSIVISLLIAAYYLVRTVKGANNPLPEKDEFAVTIFKKYCGTRKTPGLFFAFPLFGWVELLGISTEDDQEQLFQVVDKEGKVSTARFDLDDASVPLLADVFFRIVDAYKFLFGNEDSVQSMVEYVEAYLRRVFIVPADAASGKSERVMNLEEALLFKAKDMITRFNTENNENGEVHRDFVKSHWGIEVFRIQIRDFDLNEEQRKALNMKLEAKKRKEAAREDADAEAVRADGKARGIERLAKASRVEFAENAAGYSDAVNSFAGKVEPDEVLFHIREMRKFGMPNATLVISDGGGNAAFGAQFEAGRQAYNRNNERKEPNAETILPKKRPDGSKEGTGSSDKKPNG